MDGTASAGTSASYARADHVHSTDTSRQATMPGVAGDGKNGITVAGAVAVSATATAQDVISKSTPYADVRAYGAKGDGVTDDSAAIQAALNASCGKTLYLPKLASPGQVDFYLASSLTIGCPVTLVGSMGGYGNGSTLKFAAGLTGIFITNTANGSILRNLDLVGGDGWTGSNVATFVLTGTHDGININASRIELEDVSASNFSRDGVHLDSVGPPYGNSNLWRFRRVLSSHNQGHGFYFNGGDANTGTCDGCSATNNQLWGIIDQSTLGNTFIQPHTDGNHIDGTGGTGAAVWTAAGVDGGPYKAIGASQFSTWINPYSEGGQPLSKLNYRQLILGGDQGAGYDGSLSPYAFDVTSSGITARAANFYNNYDNGFYPSWRAGKTARQELDFILYDYLNTMQWRWHWMNSSNNNIMLQHSPSGITRLQISGLTSGASNTELSAEATGAVQVNRSAGTGTGGFQVWSGGAAPTQVGSIDGSGNLVLSGGITASNASTQVNGQTCALGGSCTITASASGETSGVTPWLSYVGDGSEGAYTCTTGTCALSGEHWYSSFNVSSGAIVSQNVGTNLPLIIRSTGACTIAGTISVSPNTGSAAGMTASPAYGGTGGGGGGGTLPGNAGYPSGIGAYPGGPGGTASGGAGQNGYGPVSPPYLRTFLTHGPAGLINGSMATYGGTQGGTGGSSGPVAGRGGGFLALLCDSINFTGTIDASGQAGVASTGNNIGASGPGGGGLLVMAAHTWTTNTGTVNLAGGSPGTCGSYTGCGPSGTGGTGTSYSATIQ
jgi:hypothetical protein